MERKLVRTRAAERDLAEQVEYIARDRPAAARRYLLALENAFDRMLEMPEAGATRAFQDPRLEGIRMWPVPGFPRFLIFYRVQQGEVEVIRILHGARNIARILGDEH